MTLGPLRARRPDESGFTFIEVLTVVLMIAVLLLIAIPAFLGAKAKANDRSAQSNLRNAFSNAKTVYTDTDSYAGVTVARLQAMESSLTFTASASSSPKVVSVASSAAGVVLAAQSKSGLCYVIGDAGNAAGTVFRNLGTASCEAASVPALPFSIPTVETAAPGGAWAKSW